jgi:hypothetical protein
LIPFLRTYFILIAGFSLEPLELSSCGCPISNFEALLHDFLAGSIDSPVNSTGGVAEDMSISFLYTCFLLTVGFSLEPVGFGVLLGLPCVTTLGRYFFCFGFCYGVSFRSVPWLPLFSGL